MAVAALFLGCALAVAGCGSLNAPSGTPEAERAQELVASAKSAGVAPHLTVGVAESLYGATAPTVCKVFAGRLTTAEKERSAR